MLRSCQRKPSLGSTKAQYSDQRTVTDVPCSSGFWLLGFALAVCQRVVILSLRPDRLQV